MNTALLVFSLLAWSPITETPLELAPEIPETAQVLFDVESKNARQTRVTVAFDATRLWVKIVSCGNCQKPTGELIVAEIDKLSATDRDRLAKMLALPTAPIAPHEWNHQLLIARDSKLDGIGAPCGDSGGILFGWCGSDGRVSRVNARGWIRLPLRARQVGEVWLDGDVIYIRWDPCPGCAVYRRGTAAIDLGRLTRAQARALHAELKLGSKRVPTDAAGWRTALGAN